MNESATSDELLVHGTCVALSQSAALIRGAPGSGKSDLALRFISLFGGRDNGKQAAGLVADDQVLLARAGQGLTARSPRAIGGLLEVRGVGIIKVPFRRAAPLTLIVDLVAAGDVPRLPPDPLPRDVFLGVAVPVVKLNPFEVSSAVKLKLVLMGRP